MVHFPGLTRTDLCIQSAVTWFYQDGFPHSEIPGSKPACGSPRLIAACHVLHRLLLPRHPPCALSSLTTKFTQHTQSAFGIRLSPSAKSKSNTPLKSYGPLSRICDPVLKADAPGTVSYQRETIQALIKIYVRLVIAQSIQLSNIVLADFRQLTCLSRFELFAVSFRFQFKDQTEAYSLQSIQPNVRCQISWHPTLSWSLRPPQLPTYKQKH